MILPRLTRAISRARLPFCLAAALGAVSLLAPAQAAEPDGGLKVEALRVAFMRNAFISLNRNDAEAAFKVFTRTVGHQRGYDVNTSVEVFDDSGKLEAAIKAGTVDMVIPDTWSYLHMDIHTLVKPCFVSSDRGEVARRYVVLTRRDSGLKTLADLRGKTLNVFAAPNANLGLRWLEAALREQGVGTPADFFGAMEELSKPTAVVLPVFFGKKQACLVDSSGYDLMVELNPQVGKDLQIVTASEPLLNAVICLSVSGWSSPRFKKELEESLAELHLEPAGQQILTLFKTGRLMPFEEA